MSGHVRRLGDRERAALPASQSQMQGPAERFEQGQAATRDVLALSVAGLRGGGWRGSAEALVSAEIEGGPLEAARLAGALLTRAFSLPDR